VTLFGFRDSCLRLKLNKGYKLCFEMVNYKKKAGKKTKTASHSITGEKPSGGTFIPYNSRALAYVSEDYYVQVYHS